jgi:hypothetical protein
VNFFYIETKIQIRELYRDQKYILLLSKKKYILLKKNISLEKRVDESDKRINENPT